jgi:hypothetical protein
MQIAGPVLPLPPLSDSLSKWGVGELAFLTSSQETVLLV